MCEYFAWYIFPFSLLVLLWRIYLRYKSKQSGFYLNPMKSKLYTLLIWITALFALSCASDAIFMK